MITSNFYNVVMQPTTLCNADCEYCYLPLRHKNMLMDVNVAKAIAEAIEEQDAPYTVPLVWHGGEPLVTGLKRFRELIMCFEPLRKKGLVKHHIQTNGTLITDAWCKFFTEFNFQIGVSNDGPSWANAQRVDWLGKPIYDMVIRGIECLKRHNIPFAVISVIKEDTIEQVDELYEFFSTIGCVQWNLNIEEVEGTNKGTAQYVDDDRIQTFWKRLFSIWRVNPVIAIREFNYVLQYADSVLRGQKDGTAEDLKIDPFPTIGYDGNVVLLSPEFAGIESEKYGDFVVGNVLTDPLSEIITRSIKASYVGEYQQAINMCAESCPFFGFCAGGQASNRYFEHGTIAVTETAYCRNSRQRLLTAVVESL